MLPGLEPRRVARLAHEAVERCELRLDGAVVLTEAGTGAYAVTPVLAAAAGAARVVALTGASRYGSAQEAVDTTSRLAEAAGVSGIEFTTLRAPQHFEAADIITNCGHVRPLDAGAIRLLKPSAVIPLMYEAWEFRESDIDLSACREAGIPVGGTNERHPDCDVFSYLGVMAVKLLLDAGLPVHGNSVLVMCDNDFAPFIREGLAGCGAVVTLCASLDAVPPGAEHDAVLVALTPPPAPVLDDREAGRLAAAGASVVAQFWGDINRDALAAVGLRCWPEVAPPKGHMGILPSAIGPDPVIRLQAAGLKVGELMWRFRSEGRSGASLAAGLADSGYGSLL